MGWLSSLLGLFNFLNTLTSWFKAREDRALVAKAVTADIAKEEARVAKIAADTFAERRPGDDAADRMQSGTF